jgi:hypothetical protein
MSENGDTEAKIIDAIYRGACDAAELVRAVALISEFFGSPGVLLGELDQARPEGQFAFGACIIDAAFFARYAPYAQFDPAPRAWAALRVGTAATTNRIFSASLRRKDMFLNEFLVPQGVDGSLGCTLLSSNGRFAQIAVFQDIKQKSYEDNDIARLERLTPHLRRSLQIRRLFLQSEARGKTLELIVDRNDTGMIGLRGDGRPVFVNSAARAVAAAQDGIGLDRNGRPVAADREAAIRLAGLAADVARGGPGGLARIPRPSGRPPYLLLVSPLPSGGDLFPNSHGGVLFAIHDPARRKSPTEQRIAQLLHIPLGAAKVVQAILDDVDLKDYAERAGISMNTVRFHLKNAFTGTETHSQAELVRVALSALSALEPHLRP